MSNSYKEWIEDRQKDALADISKIAILYDKLKERRYTEEDTLVIYVYKKTSTSYKIKYLESNTNEELLPTKTKIGFVNDKVSENAPSIEGYELVSDEVSEIVLDEDNNEIVFYYNKVAEVVTTGITDQNKPYYLIFVISTSIVGCLLYFKKKLL